IFYYPTLRPLYTLITTYLYIVFNMTLFVLIMYTNSTYLEMRYFNDQLSEFDGSCGTEHAKKGAASIPGGVQRFVLCHSSLGPDIPAVHVYNDCHYGSVNDFYADDDESSD
uniref:Uncharacterized protein n=1 Tax=Caenorhabditis japonica TaxID=281687 RepID=A0A8R1EVW4_CAEJA